MIEPFDRIKIVEREIINEGFLLTKLKELKDKKILDLYLKIDEGPDLKKVDIKGKSLIDFLHTYCDANSIDKSLIKIESDNLSQEYLWPNYTKFFDSTPFLYGQTLQFTPNKNIEKKFGLFVGSSRWPRLDLGAYLYKNYRDDTLLTFNHSNFKVEYYLKDIPVVSHLSVREFYERLPLRITQENYNDGYINYDKAYNLLPFYNQFFLDIVCETWHEGDCFMPTEKTARSIVSKTPFIIYGPIGYLKNLKKLGFKTFNTIIDESYDRYEGRERIEKIKKIISNSICNKSFKELIQIYRSIQLTLEHNLDVYLSLDEQTILKKFI
jgi:hypothetical protein